MPDEGRRVACLVGEGFDEAELRALLDGLFAAGFPVDLIGSEASALVTGKRGEPVTAEVSVDDVDPEDYQAMVIVGGYSPDHLREDPRFVDVVRRFFATGRPLAAASHGPQMLLTAGVLGGRTVTAWPTLVEELAQAGADVLGDAVVVDGNLITSRSPADCALLTHTLAERLYEIEGRTGSFTPTLLEL